MTLWRASSPAASPSLFATQGARAFKKRVSVLPGPGQRAPGRERRVLPRRGEAGKKGEASGFPSGDLEATLLQCFAKIRKGASSPTQRMSSATKRMSSAAERMSSATK
uniref:Putative secreted protein n=1 Tax=Ixodes ricinus TaxID=34613 RepID=A0A6B0UE33_IXORI